MAQGTLSPLPRFQFFDDDGTPLSDGSLETYEAGTTTPAPTYADVDLGTANENPIPLDSAGRPANNIGVEVPIYVVPGQSYKYILKRADGTVVWTQDNITGPPLTSVTLDITGTWGEDVSVSDCVYLSDGSGGKNSGRWYKADAANPYSSVIPAIGFSVADGLAGETGSIRIGGQVINLGGLSVGALHYVGTAGAITATPPALPRVVGEADTTTRLVAFPNPAVPSVDVATCDGRLTLTTGVPVTVTDVTAATSIFFAPYAGSRIALYTGSSWYLRTFTQITIAVPATTGQMYDVFVFDNAGVLTLELTAWTNDTTRATALTTQDGVLVKTGALTRRYLGSFRTTAVSGQTEDSFAKRYLWNYYHRVNRTGRVSESTNTWTYTTNTYQQANAAAANQLDFVIGVAEVELNAQVIGLAINSTGNVQVFVSIGEDSATTSAAGVQGVASNAISNSVYVPVVATLRKYPAVGRHFYAWLEKSVATGTTTWAGDNGDGTSFQSGIVGTIQG